MSRHENATTNRYLEVLLRFRRDDISAMEAVEQIQLVQRSSPPDFEPDELDTLLDRIEAGVEKGRLRTDQDGRPTLSAASKWLASYGPGLRTVNGKIACKVYWVDRMGLQLTPRTWWA